MSEPLSRRGVAATPNPNHRSGRNPQYVRDPMAAAKLAEATNFPGDDTAARLKPPGGIPRRPLLPGPDGMTDAAADAAGGAGALPKTAWGYAQRGLRWFQFQRQMGANSGWVVLFWSGVLLGTVYKLLTGYIAPWKHDNLVAKPRLRYGFSDSHNLMFNLPLHDATGYETEEIGSLTPDAFEKPRLVATEESEKMAAPAKYVVMQLREFDRKEGIDYYTRSLHAVDWPEEKAQKPVSAVLGSNRDAPAVRMAANRPLKTEHEPETDKADPHYRVAQGERDAPRDYTPRESLFDRTVLRALGLGSTAAKEREQQQQQQQQRGAGGDGENASSSGGSTKKQSGSYVGKPVDSDYVHGMVRCSAITPLNNCVADPHKTPLEVVKKMLLTLGPIHILRDPLNTYLPMRMYLKKEKRQDLLFLGLGNAGAVPAFIHRQYPHYVIDAVEPDGGLVRVLRRYFGFKDQHNLNVMLDEPAEYVRRVSASIPVHDEGGHKIGNYDAIFVDMINEYGQVPKECGRLEFLSNLRDCLAVRGVACFNLPNTDERVLNAVLSNIRMVFDGRTVLLLHCKTQANTVALTWNEASGKGYTKMSSCSDPEDFKEIMKTFIHHYHDERRMPLDLLGEVRSDGSFQALLPGKKYTVRAPQNMPR